MPARFSANEQNSAAVGRGNSHCALEMSVSSCSMHYTRYSPSRRQLKSAQRSDNFCAPTACAREVLSCCGVIE